MLSTLRDLRRFLSPEALARPRKLIADFAREHLVRGRATEESLAEYDRLLPETLPLDPAGLQECQRRAEKVPG